MLDTATEVCSAALSENGQTVAVREKTEGFRHSEMLTVFIGELLEETGWTMESLDAVCVSRGPGSYTGLRIGVSVAKGICYGTGIPLVAISSLHSMTDYVSRNLLSLAGQEYPDALLCPMLDARRMEIYTALYARDGRPLTDITADVVHENSYRGELAARNIVFFGNGASKCRTVIHHPNFPSLSGGGSCFGTVYVKAGLRTFPQPAVRKCGLF